MDELEITDDTSRNIAFFEKLEGLVRRQKSLWFSLNDSVLGDIPFTHWIIKRAINHKIIEILRHIFQEAKFPIVPMDGEEGRTAIHLAYDRGFDKACELLLNLCDESNHSDPDGVTHFHIACHINHEKAVKRYLEQGIEPNLHQFRWSRRTAKSPMHIAVQQLHPRIVELLLEHRANVNILDDYYRTPVHRLCSMIAMEECAEPKKSIAVSPKTYDKSKKIWLRLLEILCSHEGVELDTRDKDGLTPIATLLFNSMAQHQLLHDALEILLMNGADPGGAFPPSEYSALHAAIWAHIDFSSKAEYHEFSHELNANIVHMLAVYGADVNAKDRLGRSVLEAAVSMINLEAVRVLLQWGARVTGVEFKHGYFETTRHFMPSLEMVERLLAILKLLKLYDMEFRTSRETDRRLLNFLYRMDQVYNLDTFVNVVELGSEHAIYDRVKLVPRDRDGNDRHTESRRYERLKNELDVLTNYRRAIGIADFYQSVDMRLAVNCAIHEIDQSIKQNFADYENVATVQPREWDTMDLIRDLELANDVELDDGTTLLDFLRANPDRVARGFGDAGFEYRLAPKKFRIIGGVVRGSIARALARAFVTQTAAKYLGEILRREMPEDIAVAFKYLSNDEIMRFIVAGMYVLPQPMTKSKSNEVTKTKKLVIKKKEANNEDASKVNGINGDSNGIHEAEKKVNESNGINGTINGINDKENNVNEGEKIGIDVDKKEVNKPNGVHESKEGSNKNNGINGTVNGFNDEENNVSEGEKNGFDVDKKEINEPKERSNKSNGMNGRINGINHEENSEKYLNKGDKNGFDVDKEEENEPNGVHESQKEINNSVNGESHEINGEHQTKNENDSNDDDENEIDNRVNGENHEINGKHQTKYESDSNDDDENEIDKSEEDSSENDMNNDEPEY